MHIMNYTALISTGTTDDRVRGQQEVFKSSHMSEARRFFGKQESTC